MANIINSVKCRKFSCAKLFIYPFLKKFFVLSYPSGSMRKTILLYGLSLAVLTLLLKFLEYRLFVRDLSLEVYVSAIAILFTIVGVWAGRKLVGAPRKIVVSPDTPFRPDEEMMKKSGISAREYDVLKLMAAGLSNQEIADKLFVSLSTVKTHTANLFVKLDSKRRTQAIRRAKEWRLIP